MRDGEEGEAGLAGQRAQGQREPRGGDPAVGPLDARGARRHDHGGHEHPWAERPALEERTGEGEDHGHAAHDHADGGGVGLPHALDHEQVEEHEPGGGERGEAGGLAQADARQPAAGDREQEQPGERVAERLPGRERVALDDVGGRHQRAHRRQRGGGGEGASQSRAHPLFLLPLAAKAASAR